MNNRDRFGELEWVEYGPDSYPMEGVSIVENPHGLHVGRTFKDPAPIRKPKPSAWRRLVEWFNQPDSDMRAEAEVFRGLNNPFL